MLIIIIIFFIRFCVCVCLSESYLWYVHHPPLFLVSVVPVEHKISQSLQAQSL